MNWIDIVQAVISGVVVGIVVFLLDYWRSLRERRLSDFRVAANWEVSKPKVSLRNFDLRKANLSGYDFTNVNLEKANLQKTGLWATKLTDANLRDTDFRNAELVGTNLSKSTASFANFSRAIIRRHNYDQIDFCTDFSRAILRGATFRDARIEEAKFRKANLVNTDFSGALVIACDFTGADLTGAKWKKVKKAQNCIWKNVKVDDPNNYPPSLWAEIQKQNAK